MENNKPISILKIGGKLIESEQTLSLLADQIADFRPSIIVHGGGVLANTLAEKLSVPIRMHEGRRMTDKPTLEIAIMAYAGVANKRLVAALQARGINACGLSGCDMRVIISKKRTEKDRDWGYVGDVENVNTDALLMLLAQHITPILSPITYSAAGALLNTNADHVAGALARALSKKAQCELIYCMDKAGVLRDVNDPSSVIAQINETLFQTLKKDGVIHAGMLPKLENAFATLRAGVSKIRITDLHHLHAGTELIA